MPDFPPIPAAVKHVAHFMKVADEHDQRNIIVSYWSRMYAVESAMNSITGKKPPEVTAFLVAVMGWLEETKKNHSDVEGIMNTTVAQALIEEYALQLFNYADAQDKAEKFGKNVVKAFYTTGILIDTLQQFGTLSEEMYSKRKYAKWKAAYIHNCLKLGEDPFPGPPVARNLLEFSDEEDLAPSNNKTSSYFDPTPPHEETPPNEPSDPVPTYQPPPRVDPVLPIPAPRINSVSPASSTTLNPEDIEKAQKYCKWAGSALSYDDINTAIDNLQKALALLQTGKEN